MSMNHDGMRVSDGAAVPLAPVMRSADELPPASVRLAMARSRLANRRSPPAHRQMPRSKVDAKVAVGSAGKPLPHSLPGVVSFVLGLVSFVAMLGVIGYLLIFTIMNMAAISDRATPHRILTLQWAVFWLLMIQFVAFWLGLAYLAVPGERKFFNWFGMSFFWVSLALLFLLRMPPLF